MPSKKKAADEAIVNAYRDLGNVHKVAARFGMCGQSVQERLAKLGIDRSGGGKRWTEAEDAVIRREYAKHRAAGTVAKLAAQMGRGYFTLATRAGQLGLSSKAYGKTYARKIKDEEQARKVFDQFKKSKLGLLQFCSKNGWNDETIRRHIETRWPDEWDAVIESKAPKQSMYRLGRAFEYQVRDLFRRSGYFVLRSPRSGSPVDLMAVKTGCIVLIQCKRGGTIVSREWNILFELASSVGAIPVLAERPTGHGIALWRMCGTKDGQKRAQPRTAFVP